MIYIHNVDKEKVMIHINTEDKKNKTAYKNTKLFHLNSNKNMKVTSGRESMSSSVSLLKSKIQ